MPVDICAVVIAVLQGLGPGDSSSLVIQRSLRELGWWSSWLRTLIGLQHKGVVVWMSSTD